MRVSGDFGSRSGPVEFMIDSTYLIKDQPPIVEGTLLVGSVAIGDQLKLGPNKKDSSFKLVEVKDIQYKRKPVDKIVAG